ncbi:MAG: hypothetical protein ACRDOO_25455 [Actinomadura sp.]
MIDDKGDTSADANAIKALGLAAAGIIIGAFAFKLHLRGGDEKFLTYSLGLACSGFYMSSLAKLVKALRVTSSTQPGAPGAATILLISLVVALAGASIFTFSSVLANYMTTFKNPSGVETLVGLIASLIPSLGPIILGGIYFYWMQQSLCEAGWNIVAALIVALVCTGASIYVWYFLNLQYGPRIYHLVIS